MKLKVLTFALTCGFLSQEAFAHRALVEALERSTLSSELAAKVIKIPFRNGEPFAKGDVLIEYDCSLIKTQKEKTEAELVGLKIKAESYEKMVQLNSMGELELIMAQSEAKKKEAELKMANISLSKCQLKAPYDGTVLKNLVQEYEYVGEQKELMTIVGTKMLELNILIPAKSLSSVSVGQRITFVADETGSHAEGSVVGIDPSVDPVSQTIRIRAKLTSFSKAIIPGTVGNAQFGKMVSTPSSSSSRFDENEQDPFKADVTAKPQKANVPLKGAKLATPVPVKPATVTKQRTLLPGEKPAKSTTIIMPPMVEKPIKATPSSKGEQAVAHKHEEGVVGEKKPTTTPKSVLPAKEVKSETVTKTAPVKPAIVTKERTLLPGEKPAKSTTIIMPPMVEKPIKATPSSKGEQAVAHKHEEDVVGEKKPTTTPKSVLPAKEVKSETTKKTTTPVKQVAPLKEGSSLKGETPSKAPKGEMATKQAIPTKTVVPAKGGAQAKQEHTAHDGNVAKAAQAALPVKEEDKNAVSVAAHAAVVAKTKQVAPSSKQTNGVTQQSGTK